MNSIVKQTYRNLEIILVNNSSTDTSLAVCQHFKERDSRIRVTCQPNHGLTLATGELIMFVDGDDVISPDLIMTLYQQMKAENVDISCCFYYRVDNNGTYYFLQRPEYQLLEGSYSWR